MQKKAPTWFSITTAVIAWTIFAVAIGPIFIANSGHEVLAANFGSAAISFEASGSIVNATPVQETMKSENTIVIDNNAPIKDGVAVPLDQGVGETYPDKNANVDSGYTKVILHRGQNLSYVAWKYTGDANNWQAIAKASGLKTDNKSQRRVFVGTVLIIPQSLLKQDLRPSPSVELFKTILDIAIIKHEAVVDLEKQLADARWWMWYWVIVSGALGVAFVLALAGYLGERKDRDLWHGQMEHFREQAAILPGNHKVFRSQEGKDIDFRIWKVEYDGIRPEITEVQCVVCGTKVKPQNALSHYFQQHPVAEPAKESC